MIFLKKRYLDNTVENKDTVSEQNKIIPNDQQVAALQDVPDNNVPSNYVTLMNKLFRNQKLNLTEAPDSVYENEAWAPEAGYVGLFHKHRVNSEEYLKPSSDPQ